MQVHEYEAAVKKLQEALDIERFYILSFQELVEKLIVELESYIEDKFERREGYPNMTLKYRNEIRLVEEAKLLLVESYDSEKH